MADCLFTWDELAAVTQGQWHLVSNPAAPGVSTVSTDSRQPLAGALFVALIGEVHDAHKFVPDALTQGAAAVLVARLPEPAVLAALAAKGVGCLLVRDTLVAYQSLGRALRRRQPELFVVAVTGSSGKTSTKEMLAAILRAKFGADAVLATEGNTNNHIGVPQNLLRLRPQHLAAVLELGTSGPGEIALLTELAQPAIAVLTSIGPVHLEGLGSVAGVAAEKSAIFDGLAARGGQAILPLALLQHDAVRKATRGVRMWTTGKLEQPVTCGIAWPTGQCGLAQARFSAHRAWRREPLAIQWRLPGSHQARNAAAAICLAAILELPDEAVQAALADLTLPGQRSKLEQVDGVTWYNDAYNANPESMVALVDLLAELTWDRQPGRLHLALGDMLEMNQDGPQFHAELLRLARAKLPQAVLYPIGPAMAAAATSLGLTGYPDLPDARAVLHAALQPGDTVALKASRGMKLERVK